MKSNIYYFDEQGRQKNWQENDSFSNYSNKNKIPNIHKFKSKSYLNKFFYAWFIICVIFIVSYIILYSNSNSNANQNKNKKLIKNNEKNKDEEEEEDNKKNSKDKVGVAFVFKDKYLSELEIMLSLLANKLINKNDKYDIYLITNKEYDFNFEYDKRIKINDNLSNKESLEAFDKKSNIKYYILNNELSKSNIKWYQSLNGGKKVIGIMDRPYLSYIYTNSASIYSMWKNNLLYDAYINIIPDDYYIYKKIGMKNTFYIPYLYNYISQKTPNSNLTYNNLLIKGKEKDIIKGATYGIKAMSLIKEKIPDAKLYILSYNHRIQFLKDLIKELNLEKNVEILYDTEISQKLYLNSSVLLHPSLSESLSMIMNEAKAHALPIIGFDLSYNPAYQKGVILVDMFDYKQMAKKAVKILSNYEYRKIKGLEAKLSLNEFSDREILDKWDKLFSVLDKNKEDEYTKFQESTYKDYYNENKAKENLESDYNYGKEFNKFFKCHTFNNLINLDYINNIKDCQN